MKNMQYNRHELNPIRVKKIVRGNIKPMLIADGREIPSNGKIIYDIGQKRPNGMFVLVRNTQN